MLFELPAIGDEERDVIAQIDALRKRAGYQISEPRRWSGMLRRVSLAKAIQGSNSIEGYVVTLDDAVAAADGEEPLEAEGEVWKAISGYRDAMTYVLQLADDPHFTYSLDLIRSLHFMMLRYDLDKSPGRWRPGAIYVHDERTDETVYEGPEAEAVPELMQQYVEGLQTDTEAHALLRGAMAHLNLVMIHPFRDGNGRMARVLQSLVIARDGILAPMFCSIEEHLGDHTQSYYDILAAVGKGSWSPERDATEWVRFCLRAHFRQAHRLLNRIKLFEKGWDYVEWQTRRLSLPDRAVPVLAYAASGARIRRRTYVAQAGVGDDTASRDLKACAEAGLLVPFGEKRGRYYMASADLRQRWQEIKSELGNPDQLDPFAEPQLPLEA